MTHKQLLQAIAQKLAIKPNEAAILWQQASKILMKELAEHEIVRIKNFGAFVVVKHKSRTVPDPREKGKKLVIFDQFLPKFRPSVQLKKRLKNIQTANLQTTEKDGLNEPPVNLSKGVNIPYANLSNLSIDPKILKLIPLHLAQRYQLAPIEKRDDKLVVAMIDPGDREAIELLNRQTGLEIIPNITTSSEIQYALDQYSTISELGPEEAGEAAVIPSEDDSLQPSNAPASKILTNLLNRAVHDKASDIHIEPEEKRLIIRFRVDGILQNVAELSKALQPSISARLKILSNLKIDESRLPQDGRIRMIIEKKEIDFRISSFPTVAGEKFVLRILDKSSGILTFDDLGITGNSLERIKDNITKSHGMVLVTGPTGSGKTTTLYSVIGQIMNGGINIVTLEDPVEYRIVGVNQSQVNTAIGYDFANGLRTMVRQDPDVILIGEIRDSETATMAIHSALTGHVVFSTLHTNDAAGAIPRLIDMGIEPFLITSSTNAIIAQRLVRKLCPKCKQEVKLPEESLTEIRQEIEAMPPAQRPKNNDLTFYQGKGCGICHQSGYKGRLGIYEVLPVTDSIRQLALKRVSAREITEKAIEEGMTTMKQDGILKALQGVTTLEEVWRVTKD